MKQRDRTSHPYGIQNTITSERIPLFFYLPSNHINEEWVCNGQTMKLHTHGLLQYMYYYVLNN